MIEKSRVIAAVCSALTKGADAEGSTLLRRDYPFTPEGTTKRQYGALESGSLLHQPSAGTQWNGHFLRIACS